MPSKPSWNPWLITCIAVICSCILIFSYYKILKQLTNRLQNTGFTRNPNQRHVLDEANPDFPSLQFHSHGLDFTVTRSLPVTQFKKKDEAEAAEPKEHNQSNTDCAVCLGEFEDGEWLKQLPKCSHEFHISCIDTWFVSHSNCPLCRTQVYDFMHEFLVQVETPPETWREDNIQENPS